MGGKEEQGDSEDSTALGLTGGVLWVLWDTGTGRGRTMLSLVEISSSKRETQATGLGSSDNSSSSLWLSTNSFLSTAVTTVFYGKSNVLHDNHNEILIEDM